jgi:hypothetical protein
MKGMKLCGKRAEPRHSDMKSLVWIDPVIAAGGGFSYGPCARRS